MEEDGSQEGHPPSVEELRALRVVDLRQKLSEAGLPQGGVKADLVQRLHKHYSLLAEEKEGKAGDSSEENANGCIEDKDSEEQAVNGTQETLKNDDGSQEETNQASDQKEDKETIAAIMDVSQEEEQTACSKEDVSEDVSQDLKTKLEENQSSNESDQLPPKEDSSLHQPLEEGLLPQDDSANLKRETHSEETFEENNKSSPGDEEGLDAMKSDPSVDEISIKEESLSQNKIPSSVDEISIKEESLSQKDVPSSVDLKIGEGNESSSSLDKIDTSIAVESSTTNVPPSTLESSPQEEEKKNGTLPIGDPLPKVFAGAKLPAFTAGPLQIPPPVEVEKNLENNTSAKSTNNGDALPAALEEAFAFKKALEEGNSKDDHSEELSKKKVIESSEMETEVALDGLGVRDEDDEGQKRSKKKKKKRKQRRNRPLEWAQAAQREKERKKATENGDSSPPVEIEYIHETLDTDLFTDPKYRGYVRVFEAFKIRGKEEVDRGEEEKEKEIQKKLRDEFKKVPKLLEEDDLIQDPEEEEDDDIPKLSKRKLKKLNRLSVAELKQLVDRPDVVEMADVTAWDPRLLVHLKSTRNSVPVPRHWCFKRKYLQGKRGIEKPPFDLPDFIKKTGIMEMRAALVEKEESKGLKSKMREKVRPKLGKIDIDYQKLHDAFFKWQTKPRMTGHGDLYYEGKEFEIRLKEKKPGDLSDDLRTALGMPVGPNAHKVPPPWLIAMQRYGPPPSYPNLKIPGLNAPIPDGCSFGYHAGGWGKPPVDETGKPLYGDVFGTADSAYAAHLPPEEIDRSLWGEMESDSEEEEEEDGSEEEDGGSDQGGVEEGGEDPSLGTQTPVVDAGLATPSGMSSVGMMGGETPELLELRKKRIEADMESSETPSLYSVLPEKRNDRIGSSMMGSTHSYDLTGQGVKANTGRGPLESIPVEMALNPEEVDLMDTEAMQIRAEAALKAQQATLAKEDFSDMVAEHAAKQSHKRKRLAAKDEGGKGSSAAGGKKYKEFKF